MKITAIQSDLFWEDKEKNLKMFEAKLEALEGAQIVVLPEMFTTGFTMNPGPFAETMNGNTVNWMKKMAAEKKIILTGSIIIEEDGKYYNRLIWMLPNGSYGYYNKRHLFAYAGEHERYTAGNRRLIASANGWKFNLIVCYDLRFPVWIRQTPDENNKVPEYDVLIVVANWPEKRVNAWKQLLISRAIENQCYVVGVNRVGTDGNGIYYSGASMMIGPTGEVLESVENSEAMLTYNLNREELHHVRKRFPFLQDADRFRFI